MVMVMECGSRAIFPLPNPSRYAALSYVWVSNIFSLSFQRVLHAPASLTTEDTVRYASKLKLEYLWVD